MTSIKEQELEESMFDARKVDAGRRPLGRVIGVLTLVALAGGMLALRAVAAPVPQSGPALTTVSDTVYRADGTPAQGTLVITWPAFSTAAGQAVAAGENTVTLGTAGALNVQLAANVGATPGNTLYTVVYQLDDGTNKTEFWMVGTTS